MSNAAEKIAEDVPKLFAPLGLSELTQNQHAFTVWSIAVNPDMRDHLENPRLYEHVASRLKMGDEIRFHAHDYSWVAYVMVTHVFGPVCKCRVMKGFEFQTPQEILDVQPVAPYHIKWRGPKKFSIMTNDGKVFAEMIEEKEDAEKQLDQLLAMIE